MGEFMRKFTKALLLELAEEFDTNVCQANRVREIRQAIRNSEDYEEEALKEYAARIWAATEQKKAEEIAEQERREREQERAEREWERVFELEKLKVINVVETNSLVSMISTVEQSREKRVNLKGLVPRIEPSKIDISLFCMVFEKQAQKENIKEIKLCLAINSFITSRCSPDNSERTSRQRG
ncbi:hypothetical protein X975_00428, partial [Stegodyphus mimosarum]